MNFASKVHLLCAGLLALLPTVATAQNGEKTFPTRPITLIVPFPAGGPSDALARAIVQPMAADLRQAIIVENVSGASGTIGLSKFIRSPADGYTIGFGTTGTHVANVALYRKLPYDPIADFEPIGLAGTASTVLIAKSSLSVSNLAEFVAYARANSANMTFGSAGIGSISHYACVALLSSLKLNITHVAYRGVAPAMNDLIGGHTDFMCDQTTTALAQINAGTIKAIAVLGGQKVTQLPDVATAASAGYSDINVRAWNALFAPKGSPGDVMARLTRALQSALADPALRSQMNAVGVDLPWPESLDSAQVSGLIASGIHQDVPVLRLRGESLD
ncbi:MAG TPA: tripartite tricarboxylate transporter substrate-binding protein [Bradyrhizobium sp.]|jgi:tripartite-type tricarboxylate transporter receptor subunit TctC|nr:tripartite tricarboxylate transporter substrate-binding protein [Bradyrhizobium sp.]